MDKVMDSNVGMLSPAADISLMGDSVMFTYVEKPTATLSSISEFEEPESSIMSTSLLSNIPCMTTAALGWIAAAMAPAILAWLLSWDAPTPSLGHPLVISRMIISSHISKLPT